MERIRVVDSHTAGEPTRVVVAGGPSLGNGSMAERLVRFREEFDRFRSAVVNEPRGSNAVVGALLCEPSDASCCAGVIFFNNVGYLGMCGHGTIGLGVTLQYLARILPGRHRVETPVGIVEIELEAGGAVTVSNVASFRHAKDVVVEVAGVGNVKGDVAWGGNWFFITEDVPCELDLRNLERLMGYTSRVRAALSRNGVTGAAGAEIDHIELSRAGRNFVLCPGKEYDRSPCGTGTSAKVACLQADGKLAEGEVWRQESILGTVFEAWYAMREGKLYPKVKGSAYVTADASLILKENDPFRWGIRA